MDLLRIVLFALAAGLLLASYLGRRAGKRRTALLLSSVAEPLDVILRGAAHSSEEASPERLLFMIRIAREHLTTAGAAPYREPAEAGKLRLAVDDADICAALRDSRAAPAALGRDPYFGALVMARDLLGRVTYSNSESTSPEAALSLAIFAAVDALTITVYRARYQGRTVLAALRQKVEGFRREVEGMEAPSSKGSL